MDSEGPRGGVLRQTGDTDLDDLLALWNDGRTMSWVGYPDGLGWSRARMDRWFADLAADPRRHHFVVEAPGLGFCGEAYYAVDPAHRRAGLDIKLRPEAQGTGVATSALSQLVQLVFDREREIDAVWTEPRPENTRSQKLYRRCGLEPRPRPSDLGPGPSYWERRRA